MKTRVGYMLLMWAVGGCSWNRAGQRSFYV